MKVLFASKNPAKVTRYVTKLKEKGFDVLTANDLDIEVDVEESGSNAIENAYLKAKAYYDATGIISIGIDNNLFLDKVSDEEQPGVKVRRVNGKTLTDDEMIEYYTNLVKKYGNHLEAKWIFGIVIYNGSERKEYTFDYNNFSLVSTPSKIIEKGYPLNSISVSPKYNKYFSELTKEERKHLINSNDKAIEFITDSLKNMDMKNQIIMLGTCAGTASEYYNACFALKINNEYFLVDTGGGNGILKMLEKADIPFDRVKHIFITHSHIDHVFGVFWIIRKAVILKYLNKLKEKINIYASTQTINDIKVISNLVISSGLRELINDVINFIVVTDREEKIILNQKVIFFDTKSSRDLEYGIKFNFESGKSLICTGDMTLNKNNYDLVENADFLIHEVYCVEQEKEKYDFIIGNSKETGHSTNKMVIDIVKNLNVQNLIFYHIGDKNIHGRKEKFTSEKYNFCGNIYAPDDLDIIDIDVE